MSDAEQIDWVSLDDHRASLRRLLKVSAERIGVCQLAHQLDEDPSTLRNQLAMREGKRPSWDLAALCFLLDPDFRAKAVGLCGEEVRRVGDLSPEEALRLIQAKACANWDRRAVADVHEVMARVRKP